MIALLLAAALSGSPSVIPEYKGTDTKCLSLQAKATKSTFGQRYAAIWNAGGAGAKAVTVSGVSGMQYYSSTVFIHDPAAERSKYGRLLAESMGKRQRKLWVKMIQHGCFDKVEVAL